MSNPLSISRVPVRGPVAFKLGIAVLATTLLSGSALAQSVDIPAIMASESKGPATAATFNYSHQFKVDIEDASSEIKRDNASLILSHRINIGHDRSLVLLGTYSLNAYDFSGGRRTSTPPVVTDNFYQWDDVHRLVLGGLFGRDVNDRWRIIVGGIVRSWGESGADFGKSITGGMITGFDYHPNENFSIGVLVGAFSALEDTVGLLPIPTLKWKFAEDWRLNVGMVRVGDPGVGLEVDWAVTETVTLGAGASFQNRRFRLGDKTRAISVPRPNRTDDGGVGQETEIPLFVQARWRPTPKIDLDFQTGVAIAGNLRVESDAGGYIKDDDYNNAPFLALKGTFAF